jgi:hypothetical protein
MSTETNANPNAANVAPIAPAQPVVQPTVQPPASQSNDDANPPWLPARLERERKNAAKEAEAIARKALLEELGGDPDSIKKLLADEKKRQDAQKSLETKLAERETALSAKDSRNKELEESVKSYAEGQLAGLTEQQKAAVIAVAGTDPPKQLKAIEALRPTWASVAPVVPQQTPNGAASPVAAQPVVPPAKPASATAPAPNAPPPAGAPVVPNHLEVYDKLNNQSSPDYKPFAAANYYLAYGKEIDAARKSRGSN